MEEIYKCPNCGHNFTHHNKIEIFARSEDKKEGIHTTIENIDPWGRNLDVKPQMSMKMDNDVSKSPGRRSAIIVTIVCENCEKESFITILQHKGETIIYRSSL